MLRFLLFTLKAVHLVILVFLVFGPLFGLGCYLGAESNLLLILHLIAAPAVIVQWQLNDGSCILTNWEKHLQPKETAPADQSIKADQGGFSRRLLHKLFGIQVSDRQLLGIIYGVLITSWLCSLALYLLL